MSIITSYPFSNGSEYTFPNSIEVTGGKAQLVLIDNAGQVFNQPFDSPTGFTLDSSKAEVVNGGVWQKDQRPDAGFSFRATYKSSIDADVGDGVLTGTGVGGPVITDGKLNLSGGAVPKYVDYDATLNADSDPSFQSGCVRFNVTPDYTGSPADIQAFFYIANTAGSNNNAVGFFHSNDGNIYYSIRDNAGVFIFGNILLGAWAPTSGVEYEMEFNWSIHPTIPAQTEVRLFIDGIQFGATGTAAIGTRDTNMTLLRIGNGPLGAWNTDCFIRDFVYFPAVQHDSNYTPKNKHNANTLTATYTTNEDGVYGDGVLTGTLNGAAAVVGNRLDLTGMVQTDYCDYTAVGNADSQQRGCIRFKLTPNYSGSPAQDQCFFRIYELPAFDDNGIWIRHLAAGNLHIRIENSTGANIVNNNQGVWNPVSGTTYEFELNFDVTLGRTQLFIDGVQFGATRANVGVRDQATTTGLRIGNDEALGYWSDYYIEDFQYFYSPQHIKDYTPAVAALPELLYAESLIQLPSFTYTGLGAIQNFSDMTSTEIATPRYNFNGFYWNGSAWVSSNGTYAQSNDIATMAANISSLPGTDTPVLKIIFPDGNILNSVSDLNLEYTGQIFSTSNPKIYPNELLNAEGLVDFAATITAAGADDVRFTISVDGVEMWWAGAAWAASTGYADTNDAATILANAASFTLLIAAGAQIRPVVHLHSNAGDTTPDIDLLTIEFDFLNPPDPDPLKCMISGYAIDAGGNVCPNAALVFTPSDSGVLDTKNYFITKDGINNAADVNGYFEQEIIRQAEYYPDGITINVSIKPTGGTNHIIENLVIPDQGAIDFNELVKANS